MANRPSSERFSDFTKPALETLIVFFSVVPALILLYFYSALPERIPVFLDFGGEVEVWAAKRVTAVLRVPAMAIDLQLICLLMKYGTVKSLTMPATMAAGNTQEYLTHQRRSTVLVASFWDWLRCFLAFKMSAESLDLLFMGNEGLLFLRTPARAITWIAAILAIAAALFYGYQLWAVRREMKEASVRIDIEKQVNKAHIMGGLLYFNPNDRAMFVPKYAFNFANKWVYVLLASIAAYPLLVFVPL